MIVWIANLLLKPKGHTTGFALGHVVLFDVLFVAFAVTGYFLLELAVEYVSWLALATLLLVVSITDLGFRIVPNTLLAALIPIVVLQIFLQGYDYWAKPVLGGLVGAAILFALAYAGELALKRPAMGGGDIKLAGVIGLLIGFPQIVFALLMGSILALIFWAATPVVCNNRPNREVPFGPFMCAAGLIVTLPPIRNIGLDCIPTM